MSKQQKLVQWAVIGTFGFAGAAIVFGLIVLLAQWAWNTSVPVIFPTVPALSFVQTAALLVIEAMLIWPFKNYSTSKK